MSARPSDGVLGCEEAGGCAGGVQSSLCWYTYIYYILYMGPMAVAKMSVMCDVAKSSHQKPNSRYDDPAPPAPSAPLPPNNYYTRCALGTERAVVLGQIEVKNIQNAWPSVPLCCPPVGVHPARRPYRPLSCKAEACPSGARRPTQRACPRRAC
eukprot:scaffold18878_cov104-Isochrysis_galbana.AAC.4